MPLQQNAAKCKRNNIKTVKPVECYVEDLQHVSIIHHVIWGYCWIVAWSNVIVFYQVHKEYKSSPKVDSTTWLTDYIEKP